MVKYDVFISYSRRDYIDENSNVIPNNIISKIKDKLKDAGISYWIDEEGINSGDKFGEIIAKRIHESSVFLFVSSKNSSKSEWTSREIAVADFYKKHIISFRVDETPFNDSVIMYVINRDFIEYWKNNEKAFVQLIKGIKGYLKEIKTTKEETSDGSDVDLKKLLADKDKELESLRKDEPANHTKQMSDIEIIPVETKQKTEQVSPIVAPKQEPILKKEVEKIPKQSQRVEKPAGSKLKYIIIGIVAFIAIIVCAIFLLRGCSGSSDSEQFAVDTLQVDSDNTVDSASVIQEDTIKANSAEKFVLLTAQSTDNSKAKKENVDKEVARPLSVSGSENGHGWVDLGLPSGIKWATCNIGASSPSEFGNYFAWGETSVKQNYTGDACVTYGKSMRDISGTYYDVARQKWGSSWRLPTRQEIEELLKNCKWEWKKEGNSKGYRVTGPNGNSIFFPVAGFKYEATVNDNGVIGYYWSSTPSTRNDCYANSLYLDADTCYRRRSGRHNGQSVRPVFVR